MRINAYAFVEILQLLTPFEKIHFEQLRAGASIVVEQFEVRLPGRGLHLRFSKICLDVLVDLASSRHVFDLAIVLRHFLQSKHREMKVGDDVTGIRDHRKTEEEIVVLLSLYLFVFKTKEKRNTALFLMNILLKLWKFWWSKICIEKEEGYQGRTWRISLSLDLEQDLVCCEFVWNNGRSFVSVLCRKVFLVISEEPVACADSWEDRKTLRKIRDILAGKENLGMRNVMG